MNKFSSVPARIESEMFIMTTKEIGDRTYKCLKMLYKNSKEIQRQCIENNIFERDNLSFAKEIATIKISSSRQTGHTTAISKFLENDAVGKWVVLMYNQKMVELFKKNFIQNEKHLITSSLDHVRGIKANGIIIDTSYLFSQSEIDEIYQVFYPCMKGTKYKYFIFVQ